MIGLRLPGEMGPGAAPGRQQLSILVIDDNPGDRRLAEMSLKVGAQDAGADCDVLLAACLADGAALLETLAAGGPDAILLDLGLPDACGFAGLHTLKALRPDVPVIILTGLDEAATAATALSSGAADYLEKDDIRPRSLWRSVSYALERKKFQEELMHLARTDPLTSVKNRRALIEGLELSMDNATRSRTYCAVLIIDIDNFKQINDLLGHDAGDELLMTVAQRIAAVIRRTDLVGRLGGDEFAVIATNLPNAHGALELAEKIAGEISSVAMLKGRRIEAGSSIGVALYPSGAVNPGDMLTHADLAMYKAKKQGSRAICLYDDNLHRELRQKLQLKRAMLRDISTPSFYLDYQPIVDCRTHRIVSAEGLARWRQRDNRVIMPGDFIPIAEENGWISDLGMQMIDQACSFLAESVAAGAPIVPISINVSPIQCRDSAFAGQFTAAIARHGLEPELFNIEITESTFMQNIESARRGLEALMSVGIGIHIDDFGTGYSSLSMLRDLPLKHLKLDRSFVSRLIGDIGTQRITEAVADLAHKLNFKTVAEGVETAEQAELLTEIGVDYLQGYYFSPPVSAIRLREELVLFGPHDAVIAAPRRTARSSRAASH
ncbi:GGDEF domain-containing response regulator [Altererythrobacter sp. CC-YST694]|uniref:putative bifunctional diguanylate cyclase/phosphodiesterase n=1 Tax=Altererythrobacter sp. CC-YST694 TaxID=2755038 RepID=UPI001D01B64E|nr:GGDEF domain-containing response regulator [Altererythrobacter sp. CC-YST694]MCB5423784.1 GGDEF domain-containing response regulator [Altererythrobacter sp. CC-YST694]